VFYPAPTYGYSPGYTYFSSAIFVGDLSSGRFTLLVTAPATEVAGIHGLSTNAMPPQGDCFMASMCCDYIATPVNSLELTRLAVPDFTYRTSLYNRVSGVLRSSLIDPLESILLLVAKIRQIVLGNFMIYRLCTQSESDRYGLYPAIEMAGISPAFVLKLFI
jgi:hypothetical protein